MGTTWSQRTAQAAGLLHIVFGLAMAPVASGGPANRSDGDECVANLHIIQDALIEYQRRHAGKLPDRLSDLLIPEVLRDGEKLFCPIALRAGKTSIETTGVTHYKQNDPLTSYSYEFSQTPLRIIARRTLRDWKRRQQELVGPRIPIVICLEHEACQLNLPRQGRVYSSADGWENEIGDLAYPDAVEGIRIGMQCRQLHLLHGCSWEGQADEPVSRLTISIAGQPDPIVKEICYGAQVLNWWHPPAAGDDLAGDTRVAWTGHNRATDSELRIYMTTFDLGAEVSVEQIDLSATADEPAPFFIAITAG